MCGAAGKAMESATQALLQADLLLAEQVITDHELIVQKARTTEEQALTVLALQAPVAGDLRAVVSALKNIADVDRMAALALHVAKLTRRRHPEKVLPEEVNGYFTEMGRIAVDMGSNVKQVVSPKTPTAPNSSLMTTTTWTICTGISSRCSWTGNGNTGWPPPST